MMNVTTADQLIGRFLRICRQSAQTLREAARSYDTQTFLFPDMAAQARAQAGEYVEVIARLEGMCSTSR